MPGFLENRQQSPALVVDGDGALPLALGLDGEEDDRRGAGHDGDDGNRGQERGQHERLGLDAAQVLADEDDADHAASLVRAASRTACRKISRRLGYVAE